MRSRHSQLHCNQGTALVSAVVCMLLLCTSLVLPIYSIESPLTQATTDLAAGNTGGMSAHHHHAVSTNAGEHGNNPTPGCAADNCTSSKDCVDSCDSNACCHVPALSVVDAYRNITANLLITRSRSANNSTVIPLHTEPLYRPPIA